MSNRNKIILTILVIVTLSVVGVCIYKVLNNDEKEITDAVKFRDEYSELNGKINENNELNYITVNVSEDNTVKYASEKEIIELLDNGTGVIYFGFSYCPWCRSLVPTLTEVAKEKNETIYYLDILDIRSSFEITDGKLNKIKDGSENYYKILELLDEELEDFYLEDEDGNKYDTEEKRLYAPTLVAVNNGVITDVHVGTVESQKSGYEELNEEQIEELEEIVTDLIDSKNVDVCTDEKC